MTRRIVIGWMLSFLAALPFRRLRLYAQVRSLGDSEIATLREAAQAALPSALGRTGTDEVVERFLRWLERYRPDVEMSPGYGRPEPRRTPELDLSLYAPQLRALGEAFRTEGSSPATKRRAIQRSLEEAGVQSLPGRPVGRHVISDLLAFYLRSSQARDLCYQAKIGRYTCPGLSGLAERPPALDEG